MVTRGRLGALLRDSGGTVEVPAVDVDAVDTTGAGDMYAAGILYGLTRDLSLSTTGMLASWLAAQVVAQYGPRLEAFDRDAAFAHAGIASLPVG